MTDHPTLRETIACMVCSLVQYRTSTDTCRRCGAATMAALILEIDCRRVLVMLRRAKAEAKQHDLAISGVAA